MKILLSSVVLLIFTLSLLASDENVQELYLKAKKLCIEQEWTEAINTFELVIEQYPQSRYVDDAYFWVGYCLEKIPQRQTDAFLKFDKVVSKFPRSNWADDAIIHQINLAEQFIREGKNQYKSFLLEKLKSDNSDILNRAALALGRLGDKRALPILKRLSNDEDVGTLASDLVSGFERIESEISKNADVDTAKMKIKILYDMQKEEPIKKQEEGNLLSFLNTQRYEQYKSMLRKDNNWSKSELNDFALWHITDTDQFQEYHSLTNEYDKKEWARKYWKSLDPTPTTEKNELKEEFDQRVIYARAHFSAFWNYNYFKYLPDQHLRDGWNHAPWDARGELYIKYGEPDVRSVEGWHTEEWIYYRYGVDFIVKQYMTNIYGNAITGGDLSRSRYGAGSYSDFNTWEPYIQANFIYNNEIKYEHNYNAEPIEDFEMEINSNINTPHGNVIITYSLPISEFDISNDNTINYQENYIIFNNDFRQVSHNETQRKIQHIRDQDDKIVQQLALSLPAGEYLIALRIKDSESNKLGIYKQNFTVE